MNIYVIFYSEHGHVFRLAQAIAEGAQSVDGASVRLFQTEKLAPDEVLEQSGAMEPRKLFAHVPVITAWELAGADAVIFGTPAKFGMMAASMRNLLDQTGPLWADGALLGKVGSVFTSTTTQQGGQESTVTSFHVTLLHLGMIIVGVPYCENRLLSMEAISGVNPYGAATLVGADDARRPSENEIGIARFQGQHVAEITRFLLLGRASSSERR
jgi:NAD(P)H dehydrogenase (quinone)